MRAKAKKKTLAYFTDIQKAKETEILDLRKRSQIINWLMIFIVLIITGWLFYSAVLKADIIYFYPSSALGNWNNVDKAIDQPDLDFDAELKYFNENNSAIFDGGGIKQIFFGGFQNPSLIETDDKQITGATLKLNFRIGNKNEWLITQQELNDLNLIEPTPTMIIVPPEEIPSPSEENTLMFSPTETNIESTNSTSTETIESSPEIELTPTTEQTPILKQTPTPLEQPTSTPTPTQSEGPTPTPLSLLKIFLKKVLAQEASPTESSLENNPTAVPTLKNTPTPEPTYISTPASTLEPTPSSEPSASPIEMPLETEDSFTPVETPMATIETSTPETSESPALEITPSAEITSTTLPTPTLAPLFIIKYTLDGENWQVLTIIDNKENYQTEFELTLTNWLEINNLQISIESTLNTNLEDNLIAFLDGAQLEIEYEAIEETPEITEPITITPTPTPIQFPFEVQQILDSLKMKTKELTEIKNLNIESNSSFSCSVEPFNIQIKEGDVKEVNVRLNKNPNALFQKITIGNLPQGLEIFFAKNIDYVITPDKDDKELVLKIIALPNSQKGNFSIPIIYQTDNLVTMCQINVVNF
ncbi:MAG: hypothetical protein N2692_02480 [Patescibacteria group bacterium]|jgi:hypothetical protein|nr:hypothetical protein [Patescibacteria group bacterium]